MAACSGSILVADSGIGIKDPITGSRAFIIYDGAFRLENCHVQGFVNSGTMLEPSGAATLHANNQLRGLTHNGPLRFSFVSQNPPASPSTFNTTLTDDGSVTGVIGTIVSDHPFMLTRGDTQINPPGGTSFVSPFKFGLLSCQFPARPSPGPVGAPTLMPPRTLTVPVATIYRLANPGLGTPAESYVENQSTSHHRQATVIVDAASGLQPGMWYEVVWPAAPQMPTPGHMAVTLDDVAAGDVAWIKLTGVPFASTADLFVERASDVRTTNSLIPTPVRLVTTFAGVTGTAYRVVGGTIELRLEVSTQPRHETVSITWR